MQWRPASGAPWRRPECPIPGQDLILPYLVGDDAIAVALASHLRRRGFLVPAIRPPTVAPGTARLRITATAAHSDADIDALAAPCAPHEPSWPDDVARGLCLLGTDTGVGKTTVAYWHFALSISLAPSAVRPFKPVETGCAQSPTDADRLADAAHSDLSPLPGHPLPLSRARSPRASPPAWRRSPSSCPQSSTVPAASSTPAGAPRGIRWGRPHALRPRAHVCLVIERIASDSTSTSFSSRPTASEPSARPPSPSTTSPAPAAAWLGVVLVDVSADRSPDQPYNAAEIHALTRAPILGTLRHCPDGDPDRIADALAADVDLRPLLGGASRGALAAR